MPRDSGSPRRPVPPVVDLRVTSQHLHHVTGDAGSDEVAAFDSGSPAEQATALLGADDLLVLRRIGASGWTHLGGVGRGAAWAGLIEVDEHTDRRLGAVLCSPSPVRVQPDGVSLGARTQHVVGPYWASSAVLVSSGADHVVVFGAASPSPALHAATDGQLTAAAEAARAAVSAVSPARLLADQVEVLAAVNELIESAPAPLDEVLQHVCRIATRALACELAAVWLPSGRFVVLQQGSSLACSAHEVSTVVRHLLDDHARGPLVVQDSATRPLPPPLSPDDGVASYLALPLALAQGRGCLLLVHAVDRARGFTTLCQHLGGRLADSAGRLIDAASAREGLELALTSSQAHAARDPLTNVGNRRSWNEALEQAGRQVAAGSPFTVVTVDLDGLKEVNDSQGHSGGDELIVACAQALRGAVRGARDVVARLGGDEFGLLLAGSDTSPQLITRRLRLSLDGVRTPSGLRLRTSIGAAVCPPFGSLPDAARRADAAMYVDKRARAGLRVPR